MERDDDERSTANERRTTPGVVAASDADHSVTDAESLPAGARAIDPLRTIRTAGDGDVAQRVRDIAVADKLTTTDADAATIGETPTDVEQLPAGARAIDLLHTIRGPAVGKVAHQVRDQAVAEHRAEALTTTDVDMLPAGARAIDPLGTIRGSASGELAQRVRDVAVAEAAQTPAIDVNATIVTRRSATAAEQARDLAYEKLRDGTADDLRDTIVLRPDQRRSSHELAIAPPRDMVAVLRESERIDSTGNAFDEDITTRRPSDDVRDDVADDMPAMPWWRNTRFLVPGAVMATVAILGIVIASQGSARRTATDAHRRAATEHASTEHASTERASTEHASTEHAAADHAADPASVFLDGEPVAIDSIAPDALEPLAPGDVARAPDSSALFESAGRGMLPVTDFTWIDHLDADELARIEAWFARARP